MLTLVLTAGAFAAEAGKDIATTLKEAGNYTKFLALLDKAGLTESLKAAGPITVFAIDDAVLGKMPQERLDRMAENMDRFKAMLQNHIVTGKVMAADIAKMKEWKLDAETTLAVTVTEGKIAIGRVNVTKSDVAASNGIIHTIDGFLSRFRNRGERAVEPETSEAAPAAAPATVDPAEAAASQAAANEAAKEAKAAAAAEPATEPVPTEPAKVDPAEAAASKEAAQEANASAREEAAEAKTEAAQ
jgi:hypothetical protein